MEALLNSSGCMDGLPEGVSGGYRSSRELLDETHDSGWLDGPATEASGPARDTELGELRRVCLAMIAASHAMLARLDRLDVSTPPSPVRHADAAPCPHVTAWQTSAPAEETTLADWPTTVLPWLQAGPEDVDAWTPAATLWPTVPSQLVQRRAPGVRVREVPTGATGLRLAATCTRSASVMLQ